MEITEYGRAMVQEHLMVPLPEYFTGGSWEDLRDLRHRLREGSKTLLDKAEKEHRDLSADEQRASEIAMGVLQVISDEIEDRTIEGRRGPRLIDEPIRPIPTNQRSDKMKNVFEPRKTWRSIFGREPKAEGLQNFGEIVQACHHGDHEKLRELRTLNAVVGSEGGFSVPEIWWSQVYDSGVEVSVALDKVQNFAMQSNTLHVPAWDSADHTTGPIGAVEGQWLGETQAATRVTPNMRTVEFKATKLAMFIAASSEILQDSSALSQAIAPLMRNSLAFSLDEAILTGSGVGRPLGVLNSGAAILSTRATPGSITFGDLYGMLGRLLPSCLANSMWLVSPSAFAVLSGLLVTAGSGSLVMGFLPGASDIRMQVLGRPVRVTEKLPSLGSAGDVVLADLSYYGLAMRESARFERTNSAQWVSDIVDMRFVLRCDGKPLIAQPFTPAGGGNTLSPFVVLNA